MAASREERFASRLSEGQPIEYKLVYLWHWPIRMMHWAAAGSLVVLIVTGFYIGSPYFLTSGEPSSHFLMGRMRFLHFAAAGVLVATAIVRVYWLFQGNRFESYKALLPISREDWVNLWKLLKKYLFIRPAEAPHYMGHNPLQQFSYTAIYGVAIVQVVTGLYMYGLSDPGGFFYTWLGWVGPALGGAQIARFLHHVLTWAWLIFLPIHIYLTVRADVLHNESRVSSIITGGRYVRADVEFVDEK
jgi:Ni/Fe-hydrogenase 1 B-type cytochrome subunit